MLVGSADLSAMDLHRWSVEDGVAFVVALVFVESLRAVADVPQRRQCRPAMLMDACGGACLVIRLMCD